MSTEKTGKLFRIKDNRILADQCRVAQSAWTRFWGLMGKERLESGAGLIIQPCNSVHTFFMRFPIDVIYLSSEGNNYKVVSIHREMKPWRMDLPVFGAGAVLELPAGSAGDLIKGDLLCLS